MFYKKYDFSGLEKQIDEQFKRVNEVFKKIDGNVNNLVTFTIKEVNTATTNHQNRNNFRVWCFTRDDKYAEYKDGNLWPQWFQMSPQVGDEVTSLDNKLTLQVIKIFNMYTQEGGYPYYSLLLGEREKTKKEVVRQGLSYEIATNQIDTPIKFSLGD